MPSIHAAGNDLALYDQVSAQNGGTSSNARNKLAKDLNTFLTLLTSQLKNQDPLSPMDSTEFTNQLVQFAQVEQQIGQNEKLEKMINVNVGSQAAMAVQYLGHYVEAEHNQVPLQDGKGRFAYGLAGDADTVGIIITDEAGKVVKTDAGKTTAGIHEYKWDGKDKDGNQVPDGTYEISVTALDRDGASVDSWTTVFGKVDGVTSSDGATVLAMGKIGVSMDKILSVTPSWAQTAPADDTGDTTTDGGDTSSDDTEQQAA